MRKYSSMYDVEKGYINEIEKLNRDYNDLTITIQIKARAEKTMRLPVTVRLQRRVLILDEEGGAHCKLKRVRNKQTKAHN